MARLPRFLFGADWTLIGCEKVLIRTPEGVMDAGVGDWIIKGVKGEFYPCKPDIFAATYDPVEDGIPSSVWLEQQPHKLEVSGSNPEGSTKLQGDPAPPPDPCPECAGKGFTRPDGSVVNAFEGSDNEATELCWRCRGRGYELD